jgi:ABC-type transport system involved in multi-copper enzyme maturation permease subunit
MNAHVFSLSDWPILHRELTRAARRPWLYVLRYGFAAFLIFQLLTLLPTSHPTPNLSYYPWSPVLDAPTVLDIRRADLMAWTAFWGRHVLLLLQELLILILLITPAATAGALGHEKDRGTLLALFGTQLHAWEIVIGKLLGRLALVICPVLVALPFLVLGEILAGRSPGRVMVALVLMMVLMFSVASASMLTAVWTRRTSDAILACYCTLILAYIGGQVVLADTAIPAWLDPSSVLEQVVTGSSSWGWAFLFQTTVWGGAGAICLALATWRIRPAGLRQMEQRSRRWLWALRRPMGNDPVAWRERHVIGLAPLPWLRMVPAWLGLLGVFCFSAIIAYDAADYATSHGLSSQLRVGNVVGAYRMLKRASTSRVTENIVTMGLVLGVVGTMVIAVRSGGSITEEKRRKTWEDLILTPLTRNEIIYGKYRGILLAAIPHLIAYVIPMFALASMAGTSGLSLAAILVGIAAIIMAAGGGIGITMAYGEEGVWWEAAFQLMEMYYSETVVAPGPTSAERALAKRHQALPVYHDATGVLLLRPSGQVLEVNWAEKSVAKPVDSHRRQFALVWAAKRYRELRVLLPRRPWQSADCPACAANGLEPSLNGPPRSLCRMCAGLGWISEPAIQKLPSAEEVGFL